MEIDAQVYQQKPIVGIVTEKSQQERVRRKYGAVQSVTLLRAEGRIVTTKA